jgi:metaxin
MEEEVNNEREAYTLVVRKPCFGLPTACPSCLSLYIYLKFAQLPFLLDFNSTYPDSGIQLFIYLFIYIYFNLLGLGNWKFWVGDLLLCV